MNREKRIDKAIGLENPYRRQPFLPQQNQDNRLRNESKQGHGREDQERTGLEPAASKPLDHFDVVLDTGGRREHHRLNRAIEKRSECLRVLLSLRDVSQVGLRELLSYDEVREALIPLVEDARGKELPPKAEKHDGTVAVKNKPRLPLDFKSQDDAFDQLEQELLNNEGPDARPGKSRSDAGKPRDETRGDRCPRRLAELHRARNDGLLDRVVRVDDEDEHEDAQGRNDGRRLIERRNRRSEEEREYIEDDRDGKAHPENGGVIAVRRFRRLNDGGVQARLNDNVADVHEHEHDGKHAELIGCENARHDDLDHESNDRGPAELKEFPKQRAYGRFLHVLCLHALPICQLLPLAQCSSCRLRTDCMIRPSGCNLMTRRA